MKASLYDQILQCLFPLTHPSTADLHAQHSQRIQAAIDSEKPVLFALPAFPAKSPNPDKTMGNLPDLGELLALYQLNHLCLRIRRIYSPGCAGHNLLRWAGAQ